MALAVAIVASGNGTNAQAMIDLMQAGILDIDIKLIFCNRPGAKVIERAKKAGIPWKMVDHKAYADRESFDTVMAEAILASKAELVVLAGYMRLLTDGFLETFRHKIINIHPSLLPAFGGGIHAGADAVNYGVKLSGCTVHIVEKEVDGGPIIIQAAVPCEAGEDEEALMSKVHAYEHRIYPQALQWFAEGRVRIEGRHVFIAKSDKERAELERDVLVWPPLEKGF